MRKHGMTHTTEYRTWRNMIQRCTNPANPGWDGYGGRGIRVCDRWLKFTNFYADMGPRPDAMTLERVDVNGDYCPENCKWATNAEQGRNKRNTRMLTYEGRTLTVSEWSRELGINHTTLFERIRKGWPVERVLGPLERIRLFPARGVSGLSLNSEDFHYEKDRRQVVSCWPGAGHCDCYLSVVCVSSVG